MTSLRRRTKFLIAFIFFQFGILLFDFIKLEGFSFLIWSLFVVFIINLIALYPGYKLRDVILISFLPITITISTVLGLIFFPNLSSLFRYVLMFSSGALFYLSLLVNNLIIAEKVEDNSLPLFRVGQIWLQILLIVLTIPFITMIYKFDLRFYTHSFLIFLYLFVSSYVYLHTFLISKRDQVANREYLLLILQSVYFPVVASIVTSFTSAESFFRATFITSVYMGMISYIRNYLDNSLNRKQIIQYIVICIFFLLVLIIFKP